MQYILFDMYGKELSRGTLSENSDWIDVHTHGSVSIYIAPNTWLNFRTSEWASFRLNLGTPKTWGEE